MNSSNSSGSKCSKNLDIVMESADEGQALLTAPIHRPSVENENGGKTKEAAHMSNAADMNTSFYQENERKSVHAAQHAPKKMKTTTTTTTAVSEDDDNKSMLKGRKRANQQQPSRVERSRRSVITFLNNITAPPTRTDGKSLRSLSVSASSIQHQPSHTNASAEQKSQVQHEKTKTMTDAASEKGHRPSKSLCGRAADDLQQANQHLNAHVGTVSNASNGEFSPLGGSAEKSANAFCATSIWSVADKLSIKSGASNASSSGHSESQSNLSVGKQPKARECPVCCVRQHPSNFQKLKTCSHLTCKSCLVKYLNLEIMESRTNISCPNCTALLHASDIYALLEHQPDLVERYEIFALRRVLSTDPDARWCPAPDCTYAVIAYSCAACPQLRCERCDTMFCYHCKNNWHPNQTCDQARAKLSGMRGFGAQSTILTDLTGNDMTKACPRCGVQIMKMNDGSCNHMQCVLCNAEFCWLCLKQINELHYLSPTGCTFWGKKPWTRKKKLLWQVGTLIGAPLGIALIAGLAVPGIICGVPIFVGRKTYQRFIYLSKTKRRLVTVLGVFGSLIVSPVLAVLTVGVGVPIMLAYVYGVVPLSLCRNGGCGGGGSNSDDSANGVSDFEAAYGEEMFAQGESVIDGPTNDKQKTKGQQQREEEKASNKSSFHHRRQSIASSGLVSLTDKVNTEDASIQAIAGSQYNFDNRSVHTVWSSGQYAVQLGTVELAQEATSYNNEDAENSSTLACCSASIVAQASERRSLSGSNAVEIRKRKGDFRAKSRATAREQGKVCEGGEIVIQQIRRSSSPLVKHTNPSVVVSPSASTLRDTDILPTVGTRWQRSRLSIRTFFRHPVNSIFGTKSTGVRS
ncbi:hypothetical protein GPALN_006447 [Globodera pallida]|nr:hypothetical protein GPALN_006447 [Globodera pallida]